MSLECHRSHVRDVPPPCCLVECPLASLSPSLSSVTLALQGLNLHLLSMGDRLEPVFREVPFVSWNPGMRSRGAVIMSRYVLQTLSQLSEFPKNKLLVYTYTHPLSLSFNPRLGFHVLVFKNAQIFMRALCKFYISIKFS